MLQARPAHVSWRDSAWTQDQAARDKRHEAVTKQLDALIKLSRHPRAAWLSANINLLNAGLRLRLRLQEIDDPGDTAEAQLVADPGLVHLAAFCAARNDYSAHSREVSLAQAALDPEDALIELSNSTTFAIEMESRVHEDMVNVHAAQLLAKLSEQAAAVQKYTQGTGEPDAPTSWKHGLDADAELGQILKQGKEKQSCFKGSQLRTDVSKLGKTFG